MKVVVCLLVALLTVSSAFNLHGARRQGARGRTSLRMSDDKDPLLLRAARGEEVERVPVWMMRQAGRHMQVSLCVVFVWLVVVLTVFSGSMCCIWFSGKLNLW